MIPCLRVLRGDCHTVWLTCHHAWSQLSLVMGTGEICSLGEFQTFSRASGTDVPGPAPVTLGVCTFDPVPTAPRPLTSAPTAPRRADAPPTTTTHHPTLSLSGLLHGH